MDIYLGLTEHMPHELASETINQHLGDQPVETNICQICIVSVHSRRRCSSRVIRYDHEDVPREYFQFKPLKYETKCRFRGLKLLMGSTGQSNDHLPPGFQRLILCVRISISSRRQPL